MTRARVLSDKVFGPATITESVYEEGVKTVALSALMGINGNIPTYISIHQIYLYTYPLYRYICPTEPVFVYSNHICIWTNKQWEDFYYERDYGKSC